MKDGQIGYRILSLVRNAVSQDSFKREVLSSLCEHLGCRTASIHLRDGDELTSWTLLLRQDSTISFTRASTRTDTAAPMETLLSGAEGVAVPFIVTDTMDGAFQFIPDADFEQDGAGDTALSTIAGILGQSIAFRMSQAALRERVKEITCLYDITNIMHRASGELERTLLDVLEVIPGAFQYPEQARVCISLHGRNYGCRATASDSKALKSDIVLSGQCQGELSVSYEEADEGSRHRSFLREEQDLLDSIARQLSFLIEERELEDERRRLEAQLRHADRLSSIGQLTAGVAHDINEPLANILGFAELLSNSDGLPEQARKDVEKIIRSSMYARDIVRKLLAFTGRISQEQAVLELNEVIRESIQFFEARCRNRNIGISLGLAENPLWLQADPSEINQILVNLIVNSIQALPDGGRIDITSRREQDDVVFEVRDNGTGIDPDHHESVFLPFFTTKERGKGTGLGLSTVLGIVRSYNGDIRVESDPGVFTRFTVRMPGVADYDG